MQYVFFYKVSQIRLRLRLRASDGSIGYFPLNKFIFDIRSFKEDKTLGIARIAESSGYAMREVWKAVRSLLRIQLVCR